MDAPEQIDRYIDGLPQGQRDLVRRLRSLIHEADPEIREEWKWGTPVFVRDGNICTIGAFRDHVKVNYFKGAALADPSGLFDAGLEAKKSRAIDFGEDDRLDEDAFRGLVRAAALSR